MWEQQNQKTGEGQKIKVCLDLILLSVTLYIKFLKINPTQWN